MNEFLTRTRICIEPGCRMQVPGILEEWGSRRPLLVTDPALVGQERVQELWAAVVAGGFDGQVFAEVEPNPRTTTAERIAAIAIDTDRDVILGIGGGSALDAAKAAAMLATNGGRATDYVGRRVFAEEPLPFVAIPTTCGTGSEVTWVSVLTDLEQQTKISIKGPAMFPTVALVDSEFLASLPNHLLASTALDALTHAIEATTSSCRNPVSDALAEKAVVLLLQNLMRAFGDKKDAVALEAVMSASTLAGLAFGNGDVAAVHCLSESIGGIHDHPHGLCNAILLTPVLRAHGVAVAVRLAELEALVSDAVGSSAEAFLQRLEELVAGVGIPRFSSLRIPRTDHGRLARAAVANGSNASNPRSMAEADYLSILDGLG